MVPTTTTTACSAGCKPELAIYDPVVAQQLNERALQASRSAADASVVVLCVAPPIYPEPLNAVPLAAVAYQLQAAAGREETPCLRRHLLVALNLRADLPVHFIAEKIVKNSELKAQQNRFRIPNSGVPNLCKILTPKDLESANLLHVRASTSKLPSQQPEPDNGAADDQQDDRKKMKGNVYSGLSVKLVDLIAGAKELQMSRWGSSDGTIIKGKGYLDFIRQCSFKENDVVEIWAFQQHTFHYFGKTMCDESLLHVLIVNKDQQPQCACPFPG